MSPELMIFHNNFLKKFRVFGRKIGLRRVLFLAAFVLFSVFDVFAEPILDRWTTDSGLPQNSVRTIVRTRDGYLWCGTFEGLARFDGVNFTVFHLGNTSEFKSNYVRALVEDRQGNLWIGIDGGGLVRYADNRFYHFTEADGVGDVNVSAMIEDKSGNLWIGTEGKGLFVYKDKKFTNYTTKDALPDNRIWALAQDSNGIWIGTNRGVSLFRSEKFENFGIESGLTGNAVLALKTDERNGLWLGTNNGLGLFKDGKLVDFGAQKTFTGKIIKSLEIDADGNLWVGTESKGLYKLGKNTLESAESIGKSGERIDYLYSDSENQLWIGTFLNGLQRLRSRRFQTIDPSGNSDGTPVTAVFESRQKILWFASLDKLYRLKDGIIERFASEMNFQTIRTISEDLEGNLLIGSDGFHRYENGSFKSYYARDGLSDNIVVSVICDRAGNIWAGTPNGLNLFKDGKFTVFDKRNGLPDVYIQSLFEDSKGNIWIGLRGGVSLYRDGQFTSWTTADGLANNLVESFYEDRDGNLWIGTAGGLNRFRDGKFSTITTRDGLYDNLAFEIVEDDEGNFWMSSNRGIYRARRGELNDFADGLIPKISSSSYGTADGMLNREFNGAEQAGTKSHDGNLYFANVSGLVKVNLPAKSENPPSVIIEKASIDGALYATDKLPEITPAQENLEISYTAISWQRSAEIKFKYRLEGLDQDWIDAGTRRTAYFSHLPPGEYTFQVIADNGEGVWNETGKSLRIKVLPPFYRKWWFLAVCVLLIFGAAFLVFRIRLSRVERARAAQEEFSRRLINAHEAERHRVAAELHDSIGQTLAMIKNRANFGIAADDAAGAKEQLEAISSQTTQAIGEVREISYNLRPYLLESLGLTKAVKSLVKKIEEVQLLATDARLDEIDNLFAPEAEMSVYRIIQESLNNVAKHAETDEAVLTIENAGGAVVIKISDNGRGFDLKTPLKKDASKGGFGLMGIGERVRMLGGTLDIQTAPGHGTLVIIKIPLKKNNAA